MKNQAKKKRYDQLYPHPLKGEDFIKEVTYQHTRTSLKEAITLIPEAYTSPEFFAIEQERVFGNSWVAVGSTGMIANPNAVLVVTVAEQSILIIRNKSGDLRGFYNVCRHRGTKMLDEGCTQLRTSRIHCPYHSWAYDFEGHCIGTPFFEKGDIPEKEKAHFETAGLENFDRKDYGLFPVNVESWGFLIFVNLNENPAPLHKQLGDLPQRFANYRFEEWTVVRHNEFVFKANYKLVGENFMEYYHLPWVHPELIQVSKVEDHYRWQGPGMYTGMTTWPISQNNKTGGWLGLPAIKGLTETEQKSAMFIWLFPNIAINVTPNHVFIMLTQPKGPTHTIEQTWILCHPESLAGESVETELEQLVEFWNLINTQDIGIVEKVQAGLSMKPYRGGRMCYHFEEPLHRFQNMIIDKMVGIERIPEGD